MAPHQCLDKGQCFEPCGALGHDPAHARKAPEPLVLAEPARPVVNISQLVPDARGKQRRVKFARVVFPATVRAADVADVVSTWEAKGFLCALRQVGPLGFSLPLDRAEYLGQPATPNNTQPAPAGTH